MLTVDGTYGVHIYDALGHRVRSTVNGSATDFIYDLSGRVESWALSGWARGEIYAGGMDLGTYDNSTTYFNHTDWLGTIRALGETRGQTGRSPVF